MKPLGLLNLRGISGQIAALVVASIVAIHLIITATFLLHRPDQLDPSDRPRPQPACRRRRSCSAPRRRAERPRLFADYRAGISATCDCRACPTDRSPRRAILRQIPSCAACVATSAAATGSFRSATTPTSTRSASCCRTARCISAKLSRDQRQRPFWSGPWMIDVAVRRDQRQPARPVGRAGLDRAAVGLRQGRRELQPERRRRAAAGTRTRRKSARWRRRSTGCGSGSPP